MLKQIEYMKSIGHKSPCIYVCPDCSISWCTKCLVAGAYQNINQYNFRRWGLKPVNEVTDICLASDEKDYDQEVVFSPLLIGHVRILFQSHRD